MPRIRANGLDIAYEVTGTGPPLVLLHGASTSGMTDVGLLLPALRDTFRCHVPDARGHGGTRWDAANGFRYEWLIDDLAAFADALGLETIHLLGFSMGAATALGFAVRHPDRVRTLVLAGLSPDREPRASVARRLFDPERIRLHDPRWAAELDARHDAGQGPGAWQRLLPAIARDVASQELHGPADLVRIECPVLLAVGDRDPFVPVDQAWRLRRQLPDARLLVVPGCGHEVFRRRPALVLEALAGFYRETLPSGDGRSPARRPAPPVTSATGDITPSLAPDTDWLKEAAR